MKRQIHRISIPEILEVGVNKLSDTGYYLKKTGFKNAVIFMDEVVRKLFGDTFHNALKLNKSLNILADYDIKSNNMEDVLEIAFSLPPNTDVIIGLGGGKVLDVSKYIAFLNDISFISIPTSTAHDGFASSGCSLYINGKRTSVHASIPFGIIVDIGVIKASPERFIYSGIGDIVSKITAVYDWLFEEQQGRTRVDDFAVMIAKKSVNSIARMPFSDINEDFFIKELVDSLTMSGISMEIAGNSSPASGSEHLISHALDKIVETPQLHGIQVGIATYIMSKVQEHRSKRVTQFLTDTGFFNYVKQLDLRVTDFEKAIDMAPSIKPNRLTYIHIPQNREKAKKLLHEDIILTEILK